MYTPLVTCRPQMIKSLKLPLSLLVRFLLLCFHGARHLLFDCDPWVCVCVSCRCVPVLDVYIQVCVTLRMIGPLKFRWI